MIPDLKLDLQPVWCGPMPAYANFYDWAIAALVFGGRHLTRLRAELCVRVVDISAIALLNERYRHRPGPTNVLSFKYQPPPKIDVDALGDLVICGPLVWSEAATLGKQTLEHWALLVVHGVLHVLGYDHEETLEWRQMMALERDILASFDIADPYEHDLV